jgi:hypothetical protein
VEDLNRGVLKVKKKSHDEKVLNIFFLAIFAIMAIAVALVFRYTIAPFIGRPTQVEQAEVVEKRIFQKLISPEGIEAEKYNDYIVAFKFSDGSVKELSVGKGNAHSGTGRNVYDSINEGDIGILTYKEIKAITGDSIGWPGRRFISFEKDPSTALND